MHPTEYFESQNKAISNNTIDGEVIDLVALGINNGWIDATIQYQAYIDFGHNNSWRQLINDTQYSELQQAYETQCLPLLEQCPDVTGTDAACLNADDSCYQYVEGVVENGPPDYPDFDVYDIVSGILFYDGRGFFKLTNLERGNHLAIRIHQRHTSRTCSAQMS